ncbi:hypothetical protein K1T71_009218 [Dendrolimus kikuchii]|uniref:Uncharacterized protein n=1 Tax=Dendrolimus kikuchii TaxID=765133 RepID=A0ACC1CUZ4_9NEOP|nr:hypothetical protein K1T71_009218 [Dendrolimus kikuchii]
MTTAEKRTEIIQYVPFMSFVHPSFWHALTDMKINVDKLNETTKKIHGRFTFRDDTGPLFEVDGTSFNKVPESDNFYANSTGTLLNKNTIEEFKSIDKAALINSIGEMIWGNLKSKTWIKNPSTLLNFFILSFADLKKFHYYYWFAFPAPSQPTIYLKEKSTKISAHFNNKNLEDILLGYKTLDETQKAFFIIAKTNNDVHVKTLSEVFHNVKDNLDISSSYLVFLDPSNSSNPGWPLRLLLAAILEHCPSLAKTNVNVIGLRCDKNGSLNNSLLYTVDVMPEGYQSVDTAGWVGWERNDKGNFGPKLANMSASMDPVILADSSSDLNVKLMKWRLVPDLDVEVMKHTKCLLLGAGTLGCHVARDLLAWGFRNITFIDNGKVSYSNPTRQVLFNYQDCLSGGRNKAQAAAENLKLILPTVNSKGIVAHIPMPGHPLGESLIDETIANIKILTEAIADHDVIFLLLDTREARWLPTLIATHYGKIVINAALGFDSYLVIRHGIASDSEHTTDVNTTWIPGGQLGCYFCNDVTAPGNSLKDRTLDQQCTVTRPGVAAIAGALAVEILVALMQHPLRVQAPAIYNLNGDEEPDIPEMQGVLGPVPHSIRGFLHSYQTVVPTCAKFRQCIACSNTVVDMYRRDSFEFLLKVFNSGKYLEEVTGLTELHLTAEMTDILTISDEDD